MLGQKGVQGCGIGKVTREDIDLQRLVGHLRRSSFQVVLAQRAAAAVLR